MNTSLISLQRWEVLAEKRGKRLGSDDDNLIYHRVVGLMRFDDGTLKFIALLNLTEEATVTDTKPVEELESLLREGRWLKSAYDPCVPKIRSMDQIQPRQKKEALACMQDRLALVRVVDNAGWGAFVPEQRSTLIWQAAGQFPKDDPAEPDRASRSPRWVRDLVLRYWRFGGSGYALLPGRMLNGTRSREERIQQAELKREQPRFSRKPGRKPKSPEAAQNAGPEITPELYVRMRAQLLKVLNDKDLRPTLARKFDRRRAIPWQLITDKLNEKLTPKTIVWGDTGGTSKNIAGVKLLTRRQVKTMGDRIIHAGDFVLLVKDWKQIELDHHVPRGDVRDVATRPGERYEADIAEVDAFFIHNETLLPIGRIFVTFIVDCFSRMIATAYPWAGDPDVRMITYGLAAAAMPKSEWGRIIGEPFADEEWPCQGLPETMVCDNGEAATHGGEHLAELVFDVVPNAPFLAFLKQAVETSFRLANVGYVDLLPASTKGPKERGTPDRQKEAKTTVALFTRQINRWACHVYNHRHLERYPEHEEFLREKTALKPIELWRDGCRIRGGALRPYVRERHLPALLESQEARIVPEGIALDGVFYDFPDNERPEWLARLKRAATAGPAKMVRVHYDRMTLNRVYLVPKDPTKPVQEVPLSRLSREWENYSRKEYDVAREFRLNQGHLVKHEHNVRKVAFGQSVATENAESTEAIRQKFGNFRQRDEVARLLGKEGQVAEQMAADTARDQALHPGPAAAKSSEAVPAHPIPTYDEILGLN
jgi:hypothetical protein